MHLKSKTVLTVDDDPAIRLLIRSALREFQEVNVLEAPDGQAGLEQIQKHKPDVVVLDVVMPRLNGIDTLNSIRRNPITSHLPVILLTGFKDREKLTPLLEQAETDFLPKPFLVEMLREKVKSRLKRLNA